MRIKTTLLFLLSLFISAQALAQCPSLTVQTTEADCGGLDEGLLEIFATGGVAPYQYSADGGFTYQTDNFFYLFASCDSAFVMDATGCAVGTDYCIFEPAVLSLSVTSDIVLCNGGCDGVGQLLATGGVAPYTYLWNSGAVGNTQTNLCAGLYSVSVEDANGCVVQASLVIQEPTLLEISLTKTDATCSNQGGSITVDPMGTGTAPYVYNWNNGPDISTIPNLTAGFYSVTVTDSNGCFAIATATIEASIKFDLSTTEASCDQADGTAMVNIISGSSNPSYLWTTGATTNAVTGLAQGWYSVSITDIDTNCRTHRNFYVDEDPSCKVRIEGFVINDAVNKDCTSDPTSYPMENRFLVLKSAGSYVGATYTDAFGYYDFLVDNGTYEVEFPLSPFDSLLCPATNPVTINAPTNGQTYSQDFYLSVKEIADLSIYLYAGASRPGFTQYQYFTYCNNGNATVDGTINYTHDPVLTNFDAGGTEDNYDAATNTATWSFTSLAPGDCSNFSINFLIPPATPLGTLLESSVNIEPSNNDFTPNNNSFTSTQTVTGSFDPNDKRNFSGRDPFGGDIHPDIEEYFYQIRFQNTGTDTAFTVVVKDVIEENLDISSLRPIAASHDYSMDVEDGNTVVFFFENIMLADSNVNEPLSHGFVNFVINRKPNLPLGTEISNEAAIYFDFNAPVITNEVVNVLAIPDAIRGQETTTFDFSVFPNPAGEVAYLNLALEQAEIFDIQVLDVQGRVHTTLLKGQQFQAGKQVLPLAIEGLANGIYFVRVKSAAGSIVRRFAKLK